MMMWFGGWWMMLIFWGALVVLLALALWAVVGRGFGDRPASSRYRQESTALDILNKRYVRGEISLEEYQAMRETLAE